MKVQNHITPIFRGLPNVLRKWESMAIPIRENLLDRRFDKHQPEKNPIYCAVQENASGKIN
ncbi:hypothetical protein G9C98_001680 [Cotesia typhae]|uniref:Uncharacterized protein n=1 Tax=Cotesia typhae TaxID=2053667 RepID=A0A8J5UTB0_9HYME|nr:hypothetical protein G9C98_001680 [Cotesia typhae]